MSRLNLRKKDSMAACWFRSVSGKWRWTKIKSTMTSLESLECLRSPFVFEKCWIKVYEWSNGKSLVTSIKKTERLTVVFVFSENDGTNEKMIRTHLRYETVKNPGLSTCAILFSHHDLRNASIDVITLSISTFSCRWRARTVRRRCLVRKTLWSTWAVSWPFWLWCMSTSDEVPSRTNGCPWFWEFTGRI